MLSKLSLSGLVHWKGRKMGVDQSQQLELSKAVSAACNGMQHLKGTCLLALSSLVCFALTSPHSLVLTSCAMMQRRERRREGKEDGAGRWAGLRCFLRSALDGLALKLSSLSLARAGRPVKSALLLVIGYGHKERCP